MHFCVGPGLCVGVGSVGMEQFVEAWLWLANLLERGSPCKNIPCKEKKKCWLALSLKSQVIFAQWHILNHMGYTLELDLPALIGNVGSGLQRHMHMYHGHWESSHCKWWLIMRKAKSGDHSGSWCSSCAEYPPMLYYITLLLFDLVPPVRGHLVPEHPWHCPCYSTAWDKSLLYLSYMWPGTDSSCEVLNLCFSWITMKGKILTPFCNG